MGELLKRTSWPDLHCGMNAGQSKEDGLKGRLSQQAAGRWVRRLPWWVRWWVRWLPYIRNGASWAVPSNGPDGNWRQGALLLGLRKWGWRRNMDQLTPAWPLPGIEPTPGMHPDREWNEQSFSGWATNWAACARAPLYLRCSNISLRCLEVLFCFTILSSTMVCFLSSVLKYSQPCSLRTVLLHWLPHSSLWESLKTNAGASQSIIHVSSFSYTLSPYLYCALGASCHQGLPLLPWTASPLWAGSTRGGLPLPSTDWDWVGNSGV